MERRLPFENDVARLLANFAQVGRTPFEQVGVETARTIYHQSCNTVKLPCVPVRHVRDARLDPMGLPVRFYDDRPGAGHPKPALIFFHGGGWVIGDLDTHDAICRRLAIESDRVVVAVDYRLAPEHRFPAAVDDAIASFAAIQAQADGFGIDPNDIAVGGDSAGGTLAAVVAINAIISASPSPSAVCMFYPVTDLRGGTASYREVTGVPIVAATMAWFRDKYITDAAEMTDWRCSPLLASSLEGFPRTFLTTSGHDPLCDEGFAFAGRLRSDAVPLEHRHLPGQLHGYLTLGRLTAEAERSLAAAGSFLKAGTTG